MTDESPNCAICLGELSSTNTTTLECGHRFHYNCIFRWNRENGNCPYCRDEVNVDRGTVVNVGNLTSYSSPYDMLYDSQHNHNVRLVCTDCNHDVFSCEDCGKYMCFCEQNTQNRNGKNPFSRPNNDECYTCLECFHAREDTMLDYLIQNWDYDIYHTNYVHDMYDKYFHNCNDQHTPEAPYISFNTYEDFEDYSREIVEEEMRQNAIAEENFDDYYNGMTQEEIDDINQMNSEINQLLNSNDDNENVIENVHPLNSTIMELYNTSNVSGNFEEENNILMTEQHNRSRNDLRTIINELSNIIQTNEQSEVILDTNSNVIINTNIYEDMIS